MIRRSSLLIVTLVAGGIALGLIGVTRAAETPRPVRAGWIVTACNEADCREIGDSEPTRVDCDDQLVRHVRGARKGTRLSCRRAER